MVVNLYLKTIYLYLPYNVHNEDIAVLMNDWNNRKAMFIGKLLRIIRHLDNFLTASFTISFQVNLTTLLFTCSRLFNKIKLESS